MTYRLRVRDDATGYGNVYLSQRGEWFGRPFDDRQTAEDVKRAMPNGDCFDVVEVAEAWHGAFGPEGDRAG